MGYQVHSNCHLVDNMGAELCLYVLGCYKILFAADKASIPRLEMKTGLYSETEKMI